MLIDYIADGSKDAPLVRVSSFTAESVRRLRTEVARLAAGEATSVRVTDLPDVRADVTLDLHVAETNRGLSATPPHLHCHLTSPSWQGIEGLLDPFASDSPDGHQWLDDTGEVSLLISADGSW